MKLYRKFIKPILVYPGPHYESLQKNIEIPEKWYPEEKEQELFQKYMHLENSTCWEKLVMEVKYEEYDLS